MSPYRYRDHKGSLEESLKTVKLFGELKDLIDYLRNNLKEYGIEVKDSDIIIRYYGYDSRINWDTYLISVNGFGVVGFTDRKPE